MAGKKHKPYHYSQYNPLTGKAIGVVIKAPTRSAQAARLAYHMGNDLKKGRTIYVGSGRQKVYITQETESPDLIRSKYLRRRRTVDAKTDYKRRVRHYKMKPKKNPNYLKGRGMPDFNPGAFDAPNLKW